MKKFRVGVSYSGSIIVEVEAETEFDAEQKAERMVEEMNDEKFLYDLEPQHAETNIIKEITDENKETNYDCS